MSLLDKISKKLTNRDYKNLFEKGLFVFDTNVLLDIYRLPNTAKEDLLSILENEKLKDRIWLPFQAQLEYVYNKNSVIRDQKTKFVQVNSLIDKYPQKINELYKDLQKEISKLELEKRHSLIKPEDYINGDLFKAAIDKLDAFKEKLNELNKKQPDVTDNDKIGERIKIIFKDKIGVTFTKNELEEIYKDGIKRYKNKVPPGYEDDKPDKDGSHFYEDKEYIRKFGDLILWKEILNKAKTDEIEYLVLVSSDVKEDWREKHSGMYTSVRYELLNEIYYFANKLKIFHIYDSYNFMKYAKEYLQLEVDDSSIQEIKDIQDEKNRQTINIVEFIDSEASYMRKDVIWLNLGSYSPNITINTDLFESFIVDVFYDAVNYFDLDGKFYMKLFPGDKNPNFINLHISVRSPSEEKIKKFTDYAFETYTWKHKALGILTFRNDSHMQLEYTLIIELMMQS